MARALSYALLNEKAYAICSLITESPIESVANALAAVEFSSDKNDFMCRTFELIEEPLNLAYGGQCWFARILSHEFSAMPGSSALVLGATPWLATLLGRTVAHTTVADASASMLDLCEKVVRHACVGSELPVIGFHKCDWLALPEVATNLDIVAGDNSLTFLRYPNDWEELLDDLANRMTDGGMLICRFLSVPDSHRGLSASEIADAAVSSPAPVNFTAVRAALLFAHWDPASLTLAPEDALRTFERCRPVFDRLLCPERAGPRNDLLSIEKYRGSGAKYFVPPLAKALPLFERRFQVRAVYFGPYEMSQYFPMVVASKLANPARAGRAGIARSVNRSKKSPDLHCRQ